MEKMNRTDLVNETNNCRGRCLLEMQKTLDAQVIAEFLETVRDFYNDDETSSKMKNIIISETNEIVELMNKKATDLCSFIDEIFLHRRQQQSSFYRLCHKLARKATPGGSCLPDESKCVCFSEENLKAYHIDSAADSKMKLLFNLEAVKETVEQICGKLLCNKCKRSSTFGHDKYSISPDCSCTVPSFASQHKIHEAILDICMNKDSELCDDSWYLTHLKRDADFYRQKTSSICSENSIDSFDVISSDDVQLGNDIVGTDLSHLSSTKEKFIAGDQSTVQISSESKVSGFPYENIYSHISSSVDSNVEFLNKFQSSPVFSFGMKSDNSNTQNYIKDDKNMPNNSESCKYIPDTTCVALNKSKPSDIVKESFSNFLNNNEISKFYNPKRKAEVSSMASPIYHNSKNQEVCLEKVNAIKSSTKHPLKRYLSDEASIDHPLKSYPSDALKNAFSSYFNKENTNKWLLK